MESYKPAVKKNDWYLQSSRANLVVAQPDRFILEFCYNVLHNRLYHMDIDQLLVNRKTLEVVALLEYILGPENKITPFKEKVCPSTARKLNVPFFIVNWDKKIGVKITDWFKGTERKLTWREFQHWLQSFENSSPPITPSIHSESCDCLECIPNLES